MAHMGNGWVHSLKLTASLPLKIGRASISEISSSSKHPFSGVNLLLVSGTREVGPLKKTPGPTCAAKSIQWIFQVPVKGGR